MPNATPAPEEGLIAFALRETRGTQCKLLIRLNPLFNGGLICFAKNTTVAEWLGVSRRTVQRAVAGLIARQMLEREIIDNNKRQITPGVKIAAFTRRMKKRKTIPVKRIRPPRSAEVIAADYGFWIDDVQAALAAAQRNNARNPEAYAVAAIRGGLTAKREAKRTPKKSAAAEPYGECDARKTPPPTNANPRMTVAERVDLFREMRRKLGLPPRE
jgi:hypothetical protein